MVCIGVKCLLPRITAERRALLMTEMATAARRVGSRSVMLGPIITCQASLLAQPRAVGFGHSADMVDLGTSALQAPAIAWLKV